MGHAYNVRESIGYYFVNASYARIYRNFNFLTTLKTIDDRQMYSKAHTFVCVYHTSLYLSY